MSSAAAPTSSISKPPRTLLTLPSELLLKIYAQLVTTYPHSGTITSTFVSLTTIARPRLTWTYGSFTALLLTHLIINSTLAPLLAPLRHSLTTELHLHPSSYSPSTSRSPWKIPSETVSPHLLPCIKVLTVHIPHINPEPLPSNVPVFPTFASLDALSSWRR